MCYLYLTVRAVMCAALSNGNTFDWCATHNTGFSFTIIHPKMILKFAAAIDPVEGRAIPADTFFQHAADSLAQDPGLFCGNRVGCNKWMQFRNMQSLICVYVAKAGEKRLVE